MILNENTIKLFIQWIKTNIGVKISNDNSFQLKDALFNISNNKKITPEKIYSELVSGKMDNQVLIDKIITPESFFFRHKKTMLFIAKRIIPDLLKSGIRPRILSVPCAYGEEPYSMAMILNDCGIDPVRVDILGVDISKNCINKARKGIYSVYSMRQTHENLKSKYFITLKNNKFRVSPAIRSSVHFERMNMLTELRNAIIPGVNVILCQNLFIYFDKKTIEKAINIIESLLDKNGWLFVDTAESGLVDKPFKRADIADGFFGYQKDFDFISKKLFKPIFPKINLQEINEIKNLKKDNAIINNLKINQNKTKVPGTSGLNNEIISQKNVILPDSLFLKAQEAYKKKEIDKALDICKSIMKGHPKNVNSVLLLMAQCFSDMGEDLEAIEKAEIILQTDDITNTPVSKEERAEAAAIMAVLLNKKGMYNQAKKYFQLLQNLMPGHDALKLYNSK